MTLPRTYRFFAALVLTLGGFAATGPSCTPQPISGAGGAGDCLGDPFVCKATETCWPNDGVTKFVCISAPTTKKLGDPCNFVGGQVVCPPGDVCIVQGTNKGVCTPYCDMMTTNARRSRPARPT